MAYHHRLYLLKEREVTHHFLCTTYEVRYGVIYYLFLKRVRRGVARESLLLVLRVVGLWAVAGGINVPLFVT